MTRLNRQRSIERLKNRSEPWDCLVIGGGATGIAIAVDAASRGLEVALVEQADLGQGTSSRSTKLIHGGVRYLKQGNITLVSDALRERRLLYQNAPHLVSTRAFLIPCRSWWQRFFYGIGLKVYDYLAGKSDFGRSHGLSRDAAVSRIPTLSADHLRGGVIYYDGQFDDARLLVTMAQTACDYGACLANYVSATRLIKDDQGRLTGVEVTDKDAAAKDPANKEAAEAFSVMAHSVINATGPFAMPSCNKISPEPIRSSLRAKAFTSFCHASSFRATRR